MTNGDVLDVNVRSLVPDVTLQFPQELGVSVTVDRMAGLKKSTSRMPSLPPKDSGHNFPRRRSCPELPSSKRLRMFLLQWLPLRLGSIVVNP